MMELARPKGLTVSRVRGLVNPLLCRSVPNDTGDKRSLKLATCRLYSVSESESETKPVGSGAQGRSTCCGCSGLSVPPAKVSRGKGEKCNTGLGERTERRQVLGLGLGTDPGCSLRIHAGGGGHGRLGEDSLWGVASGI